MTINSEIKKHKEGCREEFMWIKYLNDKRICGQIEDLKHSNHIILCFKCKAKLEAYENVKKMILELPRHNGYGFKNEKIYDFIVRKDLIGDENAKTK